jgi:hypothetical protein
MERLRKAAHEQHNLQIFNLGIKSNLLTTQIYQKYFEQKDFLNKNMSEAKFDAAFKSGDKDNSGDIGKIIFLQKLMKNMKSDPN